MAVEDDWNDCRHAAALQALLNIFDAIIEEDDDIIETMLYIPML